MDFESCISCGFKCEAICPVSRATGKFKLSDFLQRALKANEVISWPCLGCFLCDNTCPAEKSPRQLIAYNMQEYLREQENRLTDYYEEYLDHGRIGISAVNLDDLYYLDGDIDSNSNFFDQWNNIVVFPGCLVSYRFPKQVIKLFQLLIYLGADPGRIVVDDELCCGSFLRQIDGEMLRDNGKFLFSKYLRQDGTTLVITACGSCTATLRESKEYLEANHQFQERHGDPSRLTIMHYLDFLSRPAILKQLSGSLHEAANGKQVYLQFPCQAEGNLKARKMQQAGLEKLLAMLGYEPVKPKSDLTCCGSNLLDTHPDFAIEFGINRFKNITNIFKDGEGTIALGCGNCHRLLSDFKTSIEIEQDESDIQNLDTHFLLDLLVDTLGR